MLNKESRMELFAALCGLDGHDLDILKNKYEISSLENMTGFSTTALSEMKSKLIADIGQDKARRVHLFALFVSKQEVDAIDDTLTWDQISEYVRQDSSMDGLKAKRYRISTIMDRVPKKVVLLTTMMAVLIIVVRFIKNGILAQPVNADGLKSTSGLNSAEEQRKNLVVVGCTGAGKSTLCNSFLGLIGEDAYFEVGSELESCTNTAIAKEEILFGDTMTNMQVRVSDTGGLGDTKYRDYAFADDLADHVHSIGGVHGIIYVHNACNSRFDAQSHSALESISATLTDDTNFHDLNNRIAIVMTHCTDSAKRVLYNTSLPTLLCDKFEMCDVPLFWYTDYEREKASRECKWSLQLRGVLECFKNSLLGFYHTPSWRVRFGKWVEDLPAYPMHVPSVSKREELKVKHIAAVHNRMLEIRRLEQELEALQWIDQWEVRSLKRKIYELQNPGGCFSGSSQVLVRNVGYVSMKDLQIGSQVQTADGWSPVTTFLHWHPNGTVPALTITYERGRLTLTPDHLVFTVSKTGAVEAVPAREVKVRTRMLVGTAGKNSPAGSRVSDVRFTSMDGHYAPLTEAGTIVVDNIVASCYTQRERYGVSHGVSQFLMAPLRAVSPWLSYKPPAGVIHPYVHFPMSIMGY